ncbi:hypothetical protein D3C85_1236370 [compost metagenome]
MRIVFAKCISQCSGLFAAACTASTLKIIGWMWRHVVHHHGGDTANIDTHLHGSGTIQDVDLPLFEHLFI